MIATTIATAATDTASALIALVNNIDQEREPLRHRRVMHRLIEKLKSDCIEEKTTPDIVVKAECADLSPDVQSELINIVEDELLP